MKRYRRWTAPIAALLILPASALLTARPAAASGSISITDAYVSQARYNPGTAVPVTTVLKETSGSGVSFTVNAATAGSYNLTFRYGNGGTTASRVVAVDGTQVATPSFPTLNTWDAWSTVTVPVTLSAGLHTVVIWDPNSTSNAINLDNLTVTAA
jgi:uncharacterized membrane protein